MTAILREGFENRIVNTSVYTHTSGGFGGLYSTGNISGSSFVVGVGAYIQFPVSTGLTEFYMRATVELSGQGGAGGDNDKFTFLTNLGVAVAGIRIVDGGFPRLYVNGVLQGTSALAWSTGFGRIEVYYRFHASTGQIIIRQNGTETINFTGNTAPSGSSIAHWRFNCPTFNAIYIDDVGVNDTTGSANNSWCGYGHIVMLVPNGNGASSQWTGSDGNSTDNYLLVDDPSANDGNSTYVAASASSLTDDYALTNITLAGGEVVKTVWAFAVGAKDTGSPPDIQVGFISGASTVLNSATTLTTTYTEYRTPIQEVDPDTGLDWTDTAVNALKAIVKTV